MSSLGPSSTDFQLIASVNLTTSIYIISSFTLNRLIKSRIEDRHQAWQMVSSLQKCVKSIQLKLFFVFFANFIQGRNSLQFSLEDIIIISPGVQDRMMMNKIYRLFSTKPLQLSSSFLTITNKTCVKSIIIETTENSQQ